MNEKLKTVGFFVCCFFVYCVIGWGYEVIWEVIIGNGFVNKGFLYGYYLPIYGFGTLILYFMLRNLQAKKIKLFNILLFIFESILFKIGCTPYKNTIAPVVSNKLLRTLTLPFMFNISEL